MRLEYYPIEKLKQEIIEILSKYLDISEYKIFFFGSRVIGKGNERSDIDIGIDGQKPLDIETKLKIEDDIENLPTLYKIEIVDFKRVVPKFREVALQNIELIK